MLRRLELPTVLKEHVRCIPDAAHRDIIAEAIGEVFELGIMVGLREAGFHGVAEVHVFSRDEVVH